MQAELRNKIRTILTARAEDSLGYEERGTEQRKGFTGVPKLQSLERQGTFLNLIFASSKRKGQKI